MARRGFGGTALRAALGAVTGVAEGLQQRQVVADEKKRMADALARQTKMDTLAAEDRTQAQQDRLQAQRVALLKSGYVPEGMDMPGATPRKAVSTEVVDGQRYSMYSTPRQMAMQAAMEEAALKNKFKPKDELSAWERQQAADKAADRASRERIASGRASSGAGGMKPQTATDATKEGQGLKFLKDNANSQEVMLVLQKAFEENPALADRPGLIGYGLMQQAERKAKADAASKPRAGGRSLSAPPGMTKPAAAKEDDLDAAFDYYTKGGK
jgi:hypothetical protein